MIDYNLADCDIHLTDLSLIKDSSYPFTLLGFTLKNRYDQIKSRINANYNPVDVVQIHSDVKQPLEFSVIRGLPITIKPEFDPLVDRLCQLGLTPSNLDHYRDLLGEFNLTCNTNFLYLRSGVYPIDGEHYDEIVSDVNPLSSIYENAFDPQSAPNWQKINHLSIFILCHSNTFTDTLKSSIAEKNQLKLI